MTDRSGIHDEHPFAAPPGERDPARQLRGRLAAPVTIVTAGSADGRAGLTISSLVVAEGEPPMVYFLVGSTTDLFDVMEKTGRVVVHVCETRHRDLADVFAGLRPSPGGLFDGLDVVDSEWGPEIGGFGTRAYCSYEGGDEETYSVMAEATLDRVVVDGLDYPLVYFRGRYRSLG